MSAMIVLEGLDASGKQTQSKRLIEKLDSLGRSAVLFSFPRYDTPVGKIIKRMLTGELAVMLNGNGRESYRATDAEALTLQSLMLADKYDAFNDMEDAIDAGSIVICDRWTPSALCFGEADGLDPKWLQRVQEFLPVGDLNVFIDVPEEEALRRRPQMRDRFEKDRAKQKVIRANYETLWAAAAENEEETLWVKISGMGTPDAVFERIWIQVSALLEDE